MHGTTTAKRQQLFVSLLLTFTLVVPHVAYSVTPFAVTNTITTLVVLFSILLFFVTKCRLDKVGIILFISCSSAGLATWLKTGVLIQGAILLCPFVGLLCYRSLRQNRIDPRVLLWTYALLAIYFYLVYYSRLPSFFDRGQYFDEDAFVFERSSSNAIPIALNFLVFLIFNFLPKQKTPTINKRWLLFALLNLLLCSIQGSRGGVVTAALFCCYTIFPSWGRRKTYIAAIAAFIVFFTLPRGAGVEEVRFLAQTDFLRFAIQDSFLFGPNPNRLFGGLSYSYNIFLDSWQRYTFVFAAVALSLWLKKVFALRSSRKILLWLGLTLLVLTERRFFPEYSDFLIFFLLLENDD